MNLTKQQASKSLKKARAIVFIRTANLRLLSLHQLEHILADIRKKIKKAEDKLYKGVPDNG